MKKIISVLIICVMLLSSFGMSVVATSNKIEDESDNTKEIVNSSQELSEKKMFCDATTEDEFESDSLIVVFKNTKSRKLESFTSKSFSEISAKSVTDLTSRAKDRIKKQRDRKAQISRGLDVSSNATIDEMYVDENNFHQIVKIDLDIQSKENVLACVKKLEARDDVLMAFPNYYFESTSVTTNDPNRQYQWGIDQIDLPEAWEITTGSSSVKVGILDTGIDKTHPDLAGRYNSTLSKDFTGVSSPDIDVHGHGTQIAGIIGARTNNGIGVSGVCWNVSLVSLKVGVYDSNTGKAFARWDIVADAIDYAGDNNIPILNFSYCSENEYYSSLDTVLKNYSGLFVCTTTNERVDVSNGEFEHYTYSPDRTIVVAGTNSNDVLFTFYNNQGVLKGSSYSATKVHLAAPGDDIRTTNVGGGYIDTYGTSMAAPYVTGVAALLKSKYPGMDAKALKDYIESNVDVIPALSGKVKTGGRLNAYKALTNLKEFTVTYDANGGGGAPMFSDTIIYGCATPLSKNTFGKSGCDFKGWHAQRTDTGKWYYTNGTTNG